MIKESDSNNRCFPDRKPDFTRSQDLLLHRPRSFISRWPRQAAGWLPCSTVHSRCFGGHWWPQQPRFLYSSVSTRSSPHVQGPLPHHTGRCPSSSPTKFFFFAMLLPSLPPLVLPIWTIALLRRHLRWPLLLLLVPLLFQVMILRTLRLHPKLMAILPSC